MKRRDDGIFTGNTAGMTKIGTANFPWAFAHNEG
jgi:hypothetical protein